MVKEKRTAPETARSDLVGDIESYSHLLLKAFAAGARLTEADPGFSDFLLVEARNITGRLKKALQPILAESSPDDSMAWNVEASQSRRRESEPLPTGEDIADVINLALEPIASFFDLFREADGITDEPGPAAHLTTAGRGLMAAAYDQIGRVLEVVERDVGLILLDASGGHSTNFRHDLKAKLRKADV